VAITITVKGAIPQRRPLYVALSALMALIAAVGFWPTYYGPLVGLTLAQPPLIHVHAIVFTGWLALFSAQAVFAAIGRLRWHLRLGRVGIAYGVVLVLVGLTTGVWRAAALPRGGQAEGLLYVAFVDMLVFASFFGAAIRFRRRPDVHKRLMTIAATALLVAAVGRMSFLPAPRGGLAVMFLVWSSPVLLAVAHDWRHSRGVHPVYITGLVAFAFRVWSEPLALTSPWTAFATFMFRSASLL
jgi:hypothetical protein